MPRAKVTRGQRSLLLQETSQAENVHSGRGLARLSLGPQCWSPGPSSSSQALTAGSGTGSVSIQGTKPKVTVLCNAPLRPQHPGVGSNLVQRGPL